MLLSLLAFLSFFLSVCVCVCVCVCVYVLGARIEWLKKKMSIIYSVITFLKLLMLLLLLVEFSEPKTIVREREKQTKSFFIIGFLFVFVS